MNLLMTKNFIVRGKKKTKGKPTQLLAELTGLTIHLFALLI